MAKYRLIEYDSPLIGKYYKIQKKTLIGWVNMNIALDSDMTFSLQDAEKWFKFFTEGYTKKIIKIS